MKGRIVAIDRMPDGREAAAVVIDGRLEDLVIGAPDGGPVATGDVGAARVTRRVKGAAFCELAGGAEGYLREAGKVREGERVLVQTASLPEPGKAVTLTTRVLFKGPRLILTPGAPGVNVSRKIGNDRVRDALSGAVGKALKGLRLAEPPGVIVRTAARHADEDALAAELRTLADAWAERQARLADDALAPLSGAGPAATILRDWLSPRPDAILAPPDWVARVGAAGGDAAEVYGDREALDVLRPEAQAFEAAGVWDAMHALGTAATDLGGARMTVEATRALVAVDVDTGGDFSPAAGLKANLAVVRELPRQLRLRGLGGKILIDAAPMPKQQRRTVEEALGKALRSDPVETTVAGWTPLGLIEVQRKRERRPLTEVWTP